MKKPLVKVYESDVMQAVTHILSAYNIFHWRNNAGAKEMVPGRFVRYGLAGSSDYLGCGHDGRFLAVECKRPGGKLSEKQIEFLDRINLEYGVGIVVDSVESLLKQLKERKVI